MKCPRDGAQLSTVRIDGIEPDMCPKCAGVWLDYDELKVVCGLHLTEVEKNLHEGIPVTGYEAGEVEGYMRCPQCPEGRLQQITYIFRLPVRIDRCDQCLGFWVDKTELDAIVSEKKRLDEEFAARRLLMSCGSHGGHLAAGEHR